MSNTTDPRYRSTRHGQTDLRDVRLAEPLDETYALDIYLSHVLARRVNGSPNDRPYPGRLATVEVPRETVEAMLAAAQERPDERRGFTVSLQRGDAFEPHWRGRSTAA